MLTTATKIEIKLRRDHDITMAGSYNNKLLAKLPTWPDRGDSLPYNNQQIIFELESYGKSNRKEAPPSSSSSGAIHHRIEAATR